MEKMLREQQENAAQQWDKIDKMFGENVRIVFKKIATDSVFPKFVE
jgi:hypothetical protein